MSGTYLEELFGLKGRVALVTGSSRGIGRAIAEGYSQAGATVALHGRDEAKLDAAVRACGGEAAAFRADISDLEQLGRLVDEVRERFGRIDVLVNCAGMNRRQPVLEVTPETYAEIMDANLRSAYFLSQKVAPLMIAQGGGKIVHVGSVNAAIGLHSISVYGLTKAALVQTTKVMAVEWAEHNIQVNALCPGFVETDLTRVGLWGNPERRDWIMRRLCIKRPGQPEDLVGMAVYLASKASDYTTGQAFYVDGGLLAGSPW